MKASWRKTCDIHNMIYIFIEVRRREFAVTMLIPFMSNNSLLRVDFKRTTSEKHVLIIFHDLNIISYF